MNPIEIADKTPFSANVYKISTITATGSIHTDVDLRALFDHIDVIPIDSSSPGIIFMEYGNSKSEIISKGMNYKKKNRGKDVKRFDNQATMIIKMTSDSKYFVNAKMFKNGNVQMTGIKSVNDGVSAVDIVIDMIRKTHIEKGVTSVINDINSMMNCKYEIRLINSDFRVNFEIKREKLHAALTENYHNKCTYEPCIYPGVKLQYFWNKQANENGNCHCMPSCVGKGKGCGTNDCKKITVAIFQSGCVIITGASSEEQVSECYKYICRILETHMDDIKKRRFLPIASGAEK